MKGKTLVIGIIIFVIVVVAVVYFMMMATINNIKEEQSFSANGIVNIVDESSLLK